MSTIAFDTIKNTDASEEMMSLNAFCAVALLGNKGYYECIAGQPSMPLYGILQMGDSGAFVTGAPVKLIQAPSEEIYLLENAVSTAGPGQPVFKLLPSTVIKGVEVPTTSVTDGTGSFATAFQFDEPGTAFLALEVGNYEHIPFQVIVHPAGTDPAKLVAAQPAPVSQPVSAPAKKKSTGFKNFFKHLI